jgi:hypothetical protein
MISNCGRDENRSFRGGRAGDQTGEEWYIRAWYSSPWDCVLRHPDANVRNLIAELSEEAANNNKIGYDQNQRLTFWEQLTKSQYRPKNITVACETDCSAGVCGIVKAVGFLLDNAALKTKIAESGWTGVMKNMFIAAGFQVLTDPKYKNSDKYLLRGDILLNEKSHTAINVTNGVNSGEVNSATNPTVNNTANNSIVNSAIINKIQDALYFEKGKGKGVRYNVTTDLYLRYGASANKYGAVMIMKPDDVCIWYGYYNIDPDTGRKWLYVSCKGKVGYASEMYLKKV